MVESMPGKNLSQTASDLRDVAAKLKHYAQELEQIAERMDRKKIWTVDVQNVKGIRKAIKSLLPVYVASCDSKVSEGET